MTEYIHAYIKDPATKGRIRSRVRDRYEYLWELTLCGTVPLRFIVKPDGRIRYDDLLAKEAGMDEVLTRKHRVDIVPIIDRRKQYTFPFGG